METIHQLFLKLLNKYLSFPIVGAKLIEQRLEKKGLVLTASQLAEIEKKLKKHKGGSLNFNIDLSSDQQKNLGVSDSESLVIDFSDSEKEIDQFLSDFQNKLNEAMIEVIDKISDLILPDLREQFSSMLQIHSKQNTEFVTRLKKKWENPLNLLEILLMLALEAGDDFNHEFRSIAHRENNYVFEVITRLHYRACQIASEVLVLLNSGFADGAHARWRTLHEISECQ